MKNLFLIVLTLLAFSFVSCEKAQNHIYGKVSDMSTGEAVGNATIDLYYTKISSSGFSGTFEKYMSTVTDDNGNYSFEFAPVAAGEYSLRTSKKGYHSNRTDFMPEETASEYEKDLAIPKAGYIHYRIHNAYGTHIGDENDVARIKIDGINPLCSDCATSDYMSFEGLDVDESGIWNIIGGDEITITRYLVRGGSTQSNRVSKYTCEPGDTIEYIWNY